MHAEEGILRSGVAVETMIKSISFGSSPAAAIACSPARAARSDVYSSGSAMCRSRIPNVSSTHCGEDGKFATTSSFVRILDGTYEPVDLIQTLSKWLFRVLILPYQSGEQKREIAKVDAQQESRQTMEAALPIGDPNHVDSRYFRKAYAVQPS